jgi:hypothetical protein
MTFSNRSISLISSFRKELLFFSNSLFFSSTPYKYLTRDSSSSFIFSNYSIDRACLSTSLRRFLRYTEKSFYFLVRIVWNSYLTLVTCTLNY